MTLKRIIGVREEYFKPFECVQTNDWYQIELLGLESNTWNQLTVSKQMIDVY